MRDSLEESGKSLYRDCPKIGTSGGHLITAVGGYIAHVKILSETFPVKVVVLQACAGCVFLGMEFLCEYGAVIDLGENRLTLLQPVPTPEVSTVKAGAVGVLASHMNLPSRSSFLIPVESDEVSCLQVLFEGGFQLLLERGIGVARGRTTFKDRRATVLVTNFLQEPQHLTKGNVVGEIEEL